MRVFTSTSVGDDDVIEMFGPKSPDDEVVSLAFGDRNERERITIDFYEPATLDRLAAFAIEGAQALRAVLAMAESDDKPAELVTS